MNITEMKSEVLAKVSIPDYIMEIVVPNMSEYYDGDYPVDFNVSKYMKCCLHDEDTPSFRYYEETNTYYCFGCGAGGLGPNGTVIGLHMNFVKRLSNREISFNDAVTFLYKYFIEDRETENIVISNNDNKPLQSESEKIQYNMYKTKREKSVTADRTISIDKKIQFWDKCDLMDRLISVGAISTVDARAAIDDEVKQLFV